MKNNLTYVEIDLKAIKYNLKQLQILANRNKFMLPIRPRSTKIKPLPMDLLTVIKADAYGHGIDEISKLLQKQGVKFFGVSDVAEGIHLRKIGITRPILLFESTLPEFAKQIINNNLMPTICTLELAKELNKCAKVKNRRIDIHITVDTGMGRFGVWHKHAYDFIKKISGMKNLRIIGILTHFPAADTDKKFTRKQISYIYNLVTRLDKTGIIIPYVHASNSMGLAGYKTHVLNLARPGLMLYGLYPHNSLKKRVKLKPVMRVKSRVVFIKDIPKGQSISYGRTFFTKRDMKVAVIPIGYNDGFFRMLSNKASVLISGKRCKIVGRVTMDQIIVDVSKIKNARINMPVIIIGKQKGNEISADEIAKFAGTISYEIVCSLGRRLPRIYKSK